MTLKTILQDYQLGTRSLPSYKELVEIAAGYESAVEAGRVIGVRQGLEAAAEVCMRTTPDRSKVKAIGDAAHYVACRDAIRALIAEKPPSPAQDDWNAAIEQIQQAADRAYCKGVDLHRREACLGARYKIESGKFNEECLLTHKEASEQFGAHMALSDLANLFRLKRPSTGEQA